MKKISISFSNFTDVNFKEKCEYIYSSLNGNVLYVTLATLLVLVKVAMDKYIADLAASATFDRKAIANKRKSRAEVTLLLKQLGFAVMAEANGDEAMLVASGFTLIKTPGTVYIFNPGNVTLSNGISSGMMISSIRAMYGAKCYIHQICSELPTENTVWTSFTSSASKYVFENLIPGKQYWVRVAVVGSRNQIAYSTIATWFVQ